MLPFDTGSLLIGTRTQGLFLFDGGSVFPYANEANEFLITITCTMASVYRMETWHWPRCGEALSCDGSAGAYSAGT